MKMSLLQKFKKDGFTLIETIIAVSVIGLVITATAQLTQSSLSLGRTTTSRFVAFHIAEEGLEIARNMRDSNWLQNRAWRRGLDDGTYAIIENASPAGGAGRFSLQKISAGDSVPEIVLQDGQRFSRVIEITSSSETEAMRITSMVHYSQNGGQKEVSLTQELTDWKKGPL